MGLVSGVRAQGMTDFLDKAGEAAYQQDWSLLNQYLEYLIPRDRNQGVSSLSNEGKEARALAMNSTTETTLALALQVLECGDFQARWDVAKLFPNFGPVAIVPLIELLQNEAADVESRWFAARILGQFNHPTTIQALLEMVRQAEDEDLSRIAAETLAGLGATAIAALTDLLQAPATRLLAVQALAQIRCSDTIEPLLKLVDDLQPEVRARAIEALGNFHDPRIAPVLVQALEDRSGAVRRVAIAGLAVRADLATEFDLVRRLTDRLWDVNLEVCEQAINALGRIGTDAAATALAQGLRSPNIPVSLQLAIVRALSWIGNSLALNYLEAALQELTQTDAYLVCQEIVIVLGRWVTPALRSQAVGILINLLQSGHAVLDQVGVKQSLALALGELEQSQALDPLITLLADTDGSVRLHAIAALKRLNAQLAHERLELLSTQETVPRLLQQGVALALREW